MDHKRVLVGLRRDGGADGRAWRVRTEHDRLSPQGPSGREHAAT